MAGQNNFLPFATDVTANVIDQATWQALAARITGWQPGIAQSAQANKAFRQSAFVAAMLAQLMANTTNDDVLDDGNTVNFLATLGKTIIGEGSIADPGYWKFPSGLIVQWGSQGGPHANPIAILYPLAPPTGFLAGAVVDGGASVASYGLAGVSGTQFQVWSSNPASNFWWIVLTH
jgi:hypothetical protein